MGALDENNSPENNTIQNETIPNEMKIISGANSTINLENFSSESSSGNMTNVTSGISLDFEKLNAIKTKKLQTTKERIQKLIENIKRKQESMKSQSQSSLGSSELSLNRKSLRNTGASFRNRFQAQKNVIEMQKLRLQEQEKIINELKMGILTEDVRDTLKNNKIEIRELFSDCKMKLIGKVSLDYVPAEEREKFSVQTQMAPTIIHELEQRAFERMKYREMIKERKRILEETKKKMHEEALEQKRCLEEDEKKKHLEMIKQKRKEELERMKIRQANKEKFLKDLDKAVRFHDRKLLENAFSRWKFEYKWSLEKVEISGVFYRKNVLKKSFRALLDIVECRYALKYNVADEFYRKMLLMRGLEGFRENRLETIRSMQVAEDFYDFHLQRKTVRHWHIYMCKEYILQDIKMHQAAHHHKKKLLFQSFFKWQSLPTVMKLEKAKEERKQKWRQKVWEILPDFSPSEI